MTDTIHERLESSCGPCFSCGGRVSVRARSRRVKGFPQLLRSETFSLLSERQEEPPFLGQPWRKRSGNGALVGVSHLEDLVDPDAVQCHVSVRRFVKVGICPRDSALIGLRLGPIIDSSSPQNTIPQRGLPCTGFVSLASFSSSF